LRKLISLVIATMALTLAAVGVASATDLHQTPPITPTTDGNTECTADELASVQPGQVLWHFILTQTSDGKTGTLHATFSDPTATVDNVSTKIEGNAPKQVVHWTIITEIGRAHV